MTLSEKQSRMDQITAYWQDIGIIRVYDSNGNEHTGKAIGFFNGFFMMNSMEGGKVWIDFESIVSIREMGFLIRGDEF